MKQVALLALVSSVIDRWLPLTDHVILGGDWNASLRPRIGYCGAPLTVLADERILGWSVAAGLRCSAPEDPTWSSYNEQRHAVLDFFLWKSRGGGPNEVPTATAFPSPDPRHDHRGVRITLPMLAEMPPAETLWRPLRLKMQAWTRKRADWQTAVGKVLVARDAAELPSDPFARLERLKGVALTCAKRVLGESGGKLRRLIPHHSDEARRLMSRLKLLKVVRRELHTRRDGVPKAPSRAMRTQECTLDQQTLAPSPQLGHPPVGGGLKAGSACYDTNRNRGKKSCMLCDGQSDPRSRSRADNGP